MEKTGHFHTDVVVGEQFYHGRRDIYTLPCYGYLDRIIIEPKHSVPNMDAANPFRFEMALSQAGIVVPVRILVIGESVAA